MSEDIRETVRKEIAHLRRAFDEWNSAVGVVNAVAWDKVDLSDPGMLDYCMNLMCGFFLGATGLLPNVLMLNTNYRLDVKVDPATDPLAQELSSMIRPILMRLEMSQGFIRTCFERLGERIRLLYPDGASDTVN
jgi:hypothetical protein